MNGFMKNSVDIDRLVRMVMSDLGIQNSGENSSAVPLPVSSETNFAKITPSGSKSADQTVLRLTSRVVTLDQLQGISQNGLIRRVAVPVKAVITPSVRDEIKKRGWELVFDAAIPAAGKVISSTAGGSYTISASNAGQALYTQSSFLRSINFYDAAEKKAPFGKLILAFHELSEETIPASYADFLRKSVSVESYRNKCIMKTADFLAELLEEPETKSVLLTKYAAIASALCNRHRSIRAVTGTDPVQMEKDAVSLGANLLILDPCVGFFRVRQMINRFTALGAAVCPSIIQKGLEG